ncbi:unnamed protein product [Adineta steineri]|uniref:Uncharacterized protein n=1 Tax=Adineta steineri TaxID=433720 RepID=A0A818HLR5_9BILA|nr:unnamed protein product [Adineta steineri]CAF3510060.1 unnamed protein product [Adineta steineri]
MFISKNNNNEEKFQSNTSQSPQRQSPPYGDTYSDKLSQSITKGVKKIRIVIMPNYHSHQQVTDSVINQSILIG